MTSGKGTVCAERWVVKIPWLFCTSKEYFKFKNKEKEDTGVVCDFMGNCLVCLKLDGKLL